jgi:hypothetical protein
MRRLTTQCTRTQPLPGIAGDFESYPVVRLCVVSLSAHGESAPGQFMVGLR